ncbi:MAG: D-alanine--D-alanine ligase [Chloroflexi bacterium RBG_16_50_11]|nr:MAG: D-alanine--D-alanine ligase [Chloroflexi bacterium RBG_16_50_11]
MRIGLAYDLKIAVAGHSAVEDAFEEYDSPETVEIISGAIKKKGHSVVRLGGGVEFLDNTRREKVAMVFNISEGRGSYRSREAQVPSVLEMLDIPYTGSDPLCLAVCLDKPITKKLVALAGIPTPKWLLVNDEAELGRISWKKFPFPVIIKPAYEGSSKGIRLTSLAENIVQAEKEVKRIFTNYHQPVMVEEFIDGEEVTVGVIGNSPPKLVGMMRVVPKKQPKHFVYSLEVKRDYVNLVDYESPVKLPRPVLKKLEEYSLKAFQVLGCRDFSRVDFRVGHDGIPYFLEINPLPGLGTYSDLIIMAIKLGWTHEGLIGAVLDAAIERYPQCVNA